MRKLGRGLAMAGLGLLGGLGGALAGEPLFLLEPAPEARRIGFVFDLSGSMLDRISAGETQLDALRRAALGFLDSPAFERDELALIGFASDASVLCAPTRDHAQLRRAIGALKGQGDTAMGRGLEVAFEALPGSGERWILLFSDGKPHSGRDAVGHARRAANACREAGIRIAAVGTGLADRALLEELSGDPESVFLSDPARLDEAFRHSGEFIASRQMLASKPALVDFQGSLIRAGGWAALLALGAGTSLVFGQNRRLRRRPALRPREVVLLVFGAALTGAAASLTGQGSFFVLSAHETLLPVARRVAWLLLGGALGLGLSAFVPNLPRRRAAFAGAIGGAGAAECFLYLVPLAGDPAGRLAGGALLGFLCGAMILLVEASVRRAWLVSRWKNGESTTVLLGPKPILVGQSPAAHICPSWDEPLPEAIGRFELANGAIRYIDEVTGKSRRVRGGERLEFGTAFIEVHEERGRAAEHSLESAGEAPEPSGTPERTGSDPLPRERARGSPPSAPSPGVPRGALPTVLPTRLKRRQRTGS